MIRIRPFRALHYDTGTVDLSAVIAPPYDVIDDSERDALYDRSPYNVVRLILSRESDRYAAAARDLAAWRRDGVLTRDAEPALYYYMQDFAMPDGSMRQRAGLLVSLRLEPFSAGNILPHERTFPSAKADRMRLMEACRTNLSPIFGLYPGGPDTLAPAREMASAAPWLDGTDHKGGRHRVWRIAEPQRIEALRGVLEPATVFIADGHHRYETALEYRDRRRAESGAPAAEAAYDYMLVYLCPMDEPGLVILPTHRVWRGDVDPRAWLAAAEKEFVVEAARSGDGGADLSARLASERSDGVLGLRFAAADASYLLRLRDRGRVDALLADVAPVVRRLDVAVLDSFLLAHVLSLDCASAAQAGRLIYTHDEAQANAWVRDGAANAAFLLRDPRIGEVRDVCLSGQTMPQKSTYFHPKLQTGLVFHLLEGDD
jgi:uncharacterized protein (DUF1015 family)